MLFNLHVDVICYYAALAAEVHTQTVKAATYV